MGLKYLPNTYGPLVPVDSAATAAPVSAQIKTRTQRTPIIRGWSASHSARLLF